MERLKQTLTAIAPLDRSAMERARERLDSLTKPPGSLGVLEQISVRLAGMTKNPRPRIRRKMIFLLAADHGVVAEGVSAYPREVTGQMVSNFLQGGAAINVLAKHAGVEMILADLGMVSDPDPDPALLSRPIGPGTRNFFREPAMTRDQAVRAVETGVELVREADLIGTGEMGIGNTTAAGAITAAVTGRPPEETAGRGTGIDDVALQHKIQVIRGAIAKHRPDPSDGLDILAKIGGFEIGGLAGVMLGAAARRIPIVIDGFTSAAAALIAATLCHSVKDFLFAGHRSAEPGHSVSLEWLGLKPILDLDMRLGEGTGAVLAMNIIEAAGKVLDEMATFEEARVSGSAGAERGKPHGARGKA